MRWLRAAWIGLLVPIAACAPLIDWGSLGGGPAREGGAETGGSDAMVEPDARDASTADSGNGDAGRDGSPPDADSAADVAMDVVADTVVEAPALTYEQTVLQDDPLVYYRLNDPFDAATVVNDVDGGPPATVHGTTTFQKPGLITSDPTNHAALFDGTSANLTVAGSAYDFNNNTPFSLEAWILPNAIGSNTYVRLFSDEQNPGVDSTWNGYYIDLDPTTGVSFVLNHAGTICAAVDSTMPTTRTHLVAVFDGVNVTIYVNGTAFGPTVCHPGITESAPFTIGGSSVGGPFFPGVIDEVAVYDHALDGGRVQAHYEAGN